MSKNDGGPAFPIPIAGCTDGGVYNTLEQSKGALGGMTLRDYFAAKALAGWWSSSDTMCALPKDKTLVEFQTEACAKFYEWADAMLAERAKDSP